MAITSVRQEYKFIEDRQSYRTEIEIETIYRGREVSMDLGKSKNNCNKDGKPRYFNYNIYEHMTKYCQKIGKERETRNRTPYKRL